MLDPFLLKCIEWGVYACEGRGDGGGGGLIELVCVCVCV